MAKRQDLTGMPGTKYDKNKQKWLTLWVGIAVVIVALVLVFGFVIGASQVDGNSMSPTMANGQRVLFFRQEPSYERGEIVTIHMPSGEYYVKRVIGVAGDTIDIKDGEVYLNGEMLDEPYIQGPTEAQSSAVSYPLTVGENRVFVMGDNRPGSVDSRSFGEVSVKSIKGKVLGK